MTRMYYSAMRRSPHPEEKRPTQSGAAVYGYLMLVLGIAVLLITYIWEYHRVLDLSEQTRQASLEIKKLKEANHTMAVEIAALSTRSRIERLAVQKLNLSYPQPDYVVWQENPKDRFRAFEENGSLLAKADKWISQLVSIEAVEAWGAQ